MAQSSEDSPCFDVDIPDEYPWRDKDVIEELYVKREMSLNEVADAIDGSSWNISTWVKKHGFETRSISEAKRQYEHVQYYTDRNGHETWSAVYATVMVHRLIAVAEHGLGALEGHHVHHKNGVPWDNRHENLELVTPREHNRKHLKVDGVDRIRLAELYENGDCSYRVVHEQTDYDICKGTVRAIHKEFYGDEAA